MHLAIADLEFNNGHICYVFYFENDIKLNHEEKYMELSGGQNYSPISVCGGFSTEIKVD